MNTRQRTHLRIGPVRPSAALTFVALDRRLKFGRVRETFLCALKRVEVLCIPKKGNWIEVKVIADKKYRHSRLLYNCTAKVILGKKGGK